MAKNAASADWAFPYVAKLVKGKYSVAAPKAEKPQAMRVSKQDSPAKHSKPTK